MESSQGALTGVLSTVTNLPLLSPCCSPCPRLQCVCLFAQGGEALTVPCIPDSLLTPPVGKVLEPGRTLEVSLVLVTLVLLVRHI